jgi:alpha-maltose-1-phosphate synthase
MPHPNKFAIYYAGDAYSTSNKIMGRQSAGKSFMRGVARTWPRVVLHGVGQGASARESMHAQLKADGFVGDLRWIELPDWDTLAQVGCLYYPSPAAKEIAFARNAFNPAAFSTMGVTFTLASDSAMDQVADLVLPPFQPWDAMICISQAALEFTTRLHEEIRAWWSAQTGATRFNTPQLPVIPLGVDCPSFAPAAGQRESARAALQVAANEIVFLFAGRLSFHAKSNPAPMYQALEKAAKQVPVVCVEAGVYFNGSIREGFEAARRALAPSVRFVWIDGKNEALYRQAWQGADVFVSLSDNIQETFGLTPVEAMAAGLPVVISDWNGYKETVRDGIDGWRIPTVLPPSGVGEDIALRHAIGVESYDRYIGRASLATVIDPAVLDVAFLRLAKEPQLRAAMGAAGLQHAQSVFDWPVILQRYAQLATELERIRRAAGAQAAQPWVARADPFARFGHFSTRTLQGRWVVNLQARAQARLAELMPLAMVGYAFDPLLLPRESLVALTSTLAKRGALSVDALIAAAGVATPAGVRALMWLWKFDLVRIEVN